jgi:outer membrane protein assembly factor BamB
MATTFRPLASIVVSCVISAVSAQAATADWPQWRGPNRDGKSPATGLLKEWASGGPRLVWKAKGVGGGYGGPAVASGRIYLGGYVGQDDVVVGLEDKTGKTLWTTKVGPIPKSAGAGQNIDRNEGPRSTPTLDGDRLYLLGAGGCLVCLDAAAGKELWRKELTTDLGGRMMSDWGYSESVLVDADQVICTPGSPEGTVAALDKRTGKLLWRSTDLSDRAAYSSIIIANLAGTRQYVVFTDQHVAGISPTDGKMLWKAQREGRVAVVPTPIVAEDQVFVTSGYSVGCNLFRITKSGDAFAAQQVYANRDLANHHGGVVLVGDHLYGHSDSKGWICMEIKTGKLVWSERGVGKGSVTYADGNLYCRSESGAGTIALVEATPKGYVEKRRFDQVDRSNKNSWPHPVIANGKLYIRDQDLLLCYNLSSK